MAERTREPGKERKPKRIWLSEPGIKKLLPDEYKQQLRELLTQLESDPNYLGRLAAEAEALRRGGVQPERLAEVVRREKAWGEAVMHFLEVARRNAREQIYFGAGSFGHNAETLRPAAVPVAKFIHEHFPELRPVILPDDFTRTQPAEEMAQTLNEVVGGPDWGRVPPEHFAAVDAYLAEALAAGHIISRAGVRAQEVTVRKRVDNDTRMAALVQHRGGRKVGMYFGDVQFRNIGFIVGQEGNDIATLDSDTGWYPSGTLYPLPEAILSRRWQAVRDQTKVESRQGTGFTRDQIEAGIKDTKTRK